MSEAVAVAEATPAAEAPKAEAEPTHKLKVNGKEVELPLSEVIKRAQIAEAGQGAMQEAAALKREKAQLAEAFKADPRGTLAKLAKENGKDLRDHAVELLHEELQAQLADANLSEDAKEAKRLKAEIAELKAQTEKATATAHEAAVAASHQHLTAQIVGTLEALPEALRRQEWVANRVVDAWGYLVDHAEELAQKGVDLRTVTPAAVAQRVLANLRDLAKQLGSSLKDEELDDVFDEPLRKRAVARWGQAQHPGLTSTPQVREGSGGKPEAPAVPYNKRLRAMSRPFGS